MTIVAIDFGTSNTVVCYLDPASQTPQLLNLKALSKHYGPVPVIPTVAFIQNSSKIVIGAPVHHQRLGAKQPERLFQAFKREMVTDFQPPPRYLDGQAHTASSVARQFITQLWAEIQTQIKPSQVILTVPVGAFERYLTWFRDIADDLNLPPVQLIDESTAAALGYAIRRPGELVLVVDFGGGTLDVSLVRTAAPDGSERIVKAEVIAKADAYVGGTDIDTWIVQHYLQQQQTSRDVIGELAWQNLLALAERLKVKLSSQTTAQDSWFDDETFYAHDLSLQRHDLEALLEQNQLLEQVRRTVDEVIEVAYSRGVSKAEIKQVLLVGGSCQIPAVQSLLKTLFGASKVSLDRPFDAVAVGALGLSKLETLADYLRHSYAIRLWDPYSKSYTFHPIFAKGTTYPCQAKALHLQASQAHQREIHLNIGEVATLAQAEVTYGPSGQMTNAQLNQYTEFRSLQQDDQAVCVAHLDPPGQVGQDRIEVIFEVSRGRVLTATVRDMLTNKVLADQRPVAKLS